MDWPVIGSIAGVSALAGVLGVGAYVALTSEPVPTKKAARSPGLYIEAPRPAPAANPVPPYNAAVAPSLHYSPRPSENPTGAHPSARQQAALPPVRLFEPLPSLRQEPRAYANLPSEPYRPGREPPPPRLDAAPRDRPEAARPAPKPQPSPEAETPLRADPRLAKVLTAAKIARLRIGLRLQPDQVPHWSPVASVLREIAREQVALVRRGQDPDVSQDMMMRLYGAAQPLLASLTDVQKERVRSLARSLGYGHVASML
jgi:hypothetical protein